MRFNKRNEDLNFVKMKKVLMNQINNQMFSTFTNIVGDISTKEWSDWEVVFAWRPIKTVRGNWIWLKKVATRTRPSWPSIVEDENFEVEYKSITEFQLENL